MAKRIPVSDRVRSDKGARKAFVERVLAMPPTHDCIFWNPDKPQTYVNFRDRGKYYAGHVVACEHRNGPKPSAAHEVAHECGNRGCVNQLHLRWATRTENTVDALQHGTQPVGEKRWSAKLTEAQAYQIKYVDRRPSTQVAADLHVHPVTVRDIRNGRTWAHI